MIRLENVLKQYVRRGQTINALDCEELTIANGEYVAIVGPSGSGKSTCLSLLGGMLSPSQGRVWVNDVSVYEQSVSQRSALRSEWMGFVFQTFNLVPFLTAIQNVQIPLALLGRPAAEQSDRASALLERFGLGERMHHRPAELSVGQQQRVALARTLVNDPQIILADEPTGNLDPDSRSLVLDAFDAAHQEGRSVVMVTHDPVVASRSRRLLTLRDGRLAESDQAAALAAQRQSA